MEEPRSFQILSKDGLRLQCWLWAPGKPVVVAVHGMNAHGLHWRRLAERLSPRYSLVSYDLRGHGRSDKPSTGYTHDDQSGDLAAVVDRVTSAPPIVIGHSLGGRIAIPYAAQHALRGLVIVYPGMAPLGSIRAAQSVPRRRPELRFEYESEATFMDRMRRTNFLRNWSPYAEEYARELIEPSDGGGVRLRFRQDVH